MKLFVAAEVPASTVPNFEPLEFATTKVLDADASNVILIVDAPDTGTFTLR